MSGWWPSAAEEATLRFLLPMPSLRLRIGLAAALFAAGSVVLFAAPLVLQPLGVAMILCGHLPLWVRRQSLAPGGATPKHEEVWAPVGEDWGERLIELEKRGAAWDATPWELTNRRGCAMLIGVIVLIGGLVALSSPLLGLAGAPRLALVLLLLIVPQWINGLRTVWHPSELRLKAEALATAGATAKRHEDFEVVPLLALREGKRGKYPVDARLMLRPVGGEEAGLIGVQVQVALNNVRGTDHPYLYCVVLGKPGLALPGQPTVPRVGGGKPWVYETGGDDGVDFLVVRQYADNSGGWETKPPVIEELVETALDEARRLVA